MNIPELLGIGVDVRISLPEHNLEHDDIIRAAYGYAAWPEVKWKSSPGVAGAVLCSGSEIVRKYETSKEARAACDDLRLVIEMMYSR